MNEGLLVSAPAEWVRTTLADACARGGGIQTGPFGSQLHASDYVAVGVPSVMPQDIGDNRILENEIARITTEDAARLAKYALRFGDIVYSRRGDVTRRALVRRENDGWICGTGCLRVRSGAGVDPWFLAYYLGHPEVREWLVRHAVGATMPNLNTKILGAVPVVLPSAGEQRSIAAVLRALDDKIAVNKRIAATSLELGLALYSQRCGSADWRSLPLGGAARWHSGGTPKTSVPEYWGGDIPWISAASLKSSWIRDSDRSVTELGAQSGTRIAAPGSILFVVRGMSLTSEFRVGIAQCEVAFGQDCKALVAHPGIDSTTLFLAIKSNVQEILQMVDLAGHGTGRLVTDRLAALTVRLPLEGPAEKEFSAAVCPLIDRGGVAQLECTALATLRDTLLPQLMSGRLRVKDAEKIVEEHT